MLKKIAVLLLFCTVLSALCGCMDAPEQNNPSSGDVSLKLVVRREDDKNIQKEQENAINAYLAEFVKVYPGTKVTVDYEKDIPASLENYDAALMCCDDSIEYVSTQALDITSYCNTDDNFKNIIPAAKNLGLYGGKQYFVPFCYDRAVIYADKSVFSDLNISLPSDNWTYEQFTSLINNITSTQGSSRYVGVYMPYYMPYVWKVVASGSGEGWEQDGKLLFNTGKTREALDSLFSIYESGNASSRNFAVRGSQARACALCWTYAANPSYNGNHVISDAEKTRNPGTNAQSLLNEGKLYMLPLPPFNGKSIGVSSTSSSFGFLVSGSTANEQYAAALALFSQSEAGQKALNAFYGALPTNTALHSQDFWRHGILSCENSQAILSGIDGDMRDDYTDVLDFNSKLYDNNIRLRAIVSKFLVNDIKYENAAGYYDEALKGLVKWFNSVTK